MKLLVYSPESMGHAIKRQRRAKGLTQKEAGQHFNLDQTTISSIEHGAYGTRLETLFRTLAALDLEIIIQSKEDGR